MIARVTIPNSQRVNLPQLISELGQAAPEALIAVLQRAETRTTIDNERGQERLEVLDWEIQIEDVDLDEAALQTIADEHTPERTDNEEETARLEARELARLRRLLQPWIEELIQDALDRR